MGSAIVWFRRDLRLDDNPALQAALEAGHVPIPVYIHAPEEEGAWPPGAASRAWLHRSLAALDQSLRARGSRLTLVRGPTIVALDRLVASTGAEAVFWNRLYEPAIVARDARVKQHLRARGLHVASFKAALLCEPWEVMTGQDGPYRVFTPFWRKAAAWLDTPPPLPAPARLPAPPAAAGERLDDLRLRPAIDWDRHFWEAWSPGEAGALELLDAFVEGAAHGYKVQRDFPDRIGTSRLSPHLHFGEISPRRIVVRLRRESWPAGVRPDIEHYFSELGWREFSHHLLHHFPHTTGSNFDPRFDAFGWVEPDPSVLAAWQHGRTGVPIVDAGMRELWATGWMHNRVRMIVASFLTKNLRIHWRHGARWFWDTLVDADLANNTQGWQWSAGTGADAAPYFRVFNPVLQAQRFDPAGKYIRRWLPELAALPGSAVHAPWEHPELLRRLAPDYPQAPLVDLKASREAALAAWRAIR
ncbi:cryptochrome/photolyase family protein [Rehaibacterium terrae]|jgi:deoxyribodipyrimidine photo-lyase|uniref:Deoxyribodipyrimidine photo-lyase n=1 Tax=Rehaibacterium terrae TaxID=1341696 RepID=A0A7W7Y239_9GAMM|nr:deoxyribodipyrimidine photo-lyase [Rehaibacterium terrae]MBB5016707.1 deoxyribodipyrimidine photo-lyase [Rehaibacterium terrae]